MLFIDLHDLRCIVIEHTWRHSELSIVDDEVLVRIIHLILLIHHVKVLDTYHDYSFLLTDQYPIQGNMLAILHDLVSDIEAYLCQYLKMNEVKLGRKIHTRRRGRFAIFTTASEFGNEAPNL